MIGAVKPPPMSATQPDTATLAQEIAMLRSLSYSYDFAKRNQAISMLRSFAKEYKIKFPEIKPWKQESAEVFEAVKGEIISIMKKDLEKKSERDLKAMKGMYSSMPDFGGLAEQ